MVPSGEIALLILGVLAVVGIVGWYGYRHVNFFAQAISAASRSRQDNSEAASSA